jgi:hypothetical protein
MDQNNIPTVDSAAPTIPSVSSKKPNVRMWISVLLLMAIAVTSAVLYLSRGKPNIPTPASIKVTQKTALVFAKEGEIWYKNNEGESNPQQLTHTDSSIYTFRYSPANNLVAYVTGIKSTNENGYTSISPNKVILTTLDADQSEKVIYELEPFSPVPNSDYILQIRDLEFSDDGKLLAITTSDSLYIYNIKTNNTTNIFTIKPDLTGRGGGPNGVFAYYAPVISPDNSHVLVSLGLYEGGKQAVVNLNSKEITQLPYTTYISGERVIGWKNPNTLIVINYNNISEGNDSTSKIISLSWPGLGETEILVPKFVANGTGIISGNYLYFNTKSKVESDKKFDNFVAYDEFEHINKLDLTTLQVTELFSLQTAEANSGNKAILKLVKVGSKLLLDLSEFKQATGKNFYVIYQIEPGPAKIIESESSLAIYN